MELLQPQLYALLECQGKLGHLEGINMEKSEQCFPVEIQRNHQWRFFFIIDTIVEFCFFERTLLTDLFPTLWETKLGGATYGAIGAEEMPKA